MTGLSGVNLPRVLVVGISGPSSSGKTTLARLLRDVLSPLYLSDTSEVSTAARDRDDRSSPEAGANLDVPHPHRPVFILHQDDFYLPDHLIPVRKDGLQDWDCLESLDLPGLVAALRQIHKTGRPPADLISKEDQNEVGDSGVPQRLVDECREGLRSALLGRKIDLPSIAIIDGFLLFSKVIEPVPALLSMKVFLPCTRDLTIARRARRKGYVTLDGFWEDPPEYVEKVVWPNYAHYHTSLFVDGDVNGDVDQRITDRVDLKVRDSSMMENMSATLKWAVDLLIDKIIHTPESNQNVSQE